MKYNPTLLTEALRVRETKGMTWEELANYVQQRYNVLVTGNALRKACSSHSELQNRLEDAEGKAGKKFFLPFVEDYDDFIVLPYRDAMVISDVHLPFYNAELANRMIALARKFGIRTLFLIGDLFDAKGYSRYPTANNISMDDGEYEIDCARQFFTVCATQFDDIYVTIGNHEMRMLNKLERKLQFKTLLRMALHEAELGDTKIHVTEYPRVKMEGIDKPSTWLGHPENYSRIKGNVPRDLATKYQANIITGHTHHLVLTSHISGQYYICESGCLADPSKQEYLAMSFTPHPEWHPGFVMIRNEKPYIFDHGLLTDWNFWLGE